MNCFCVLECLANMKGDTLSSIETIVFSGPEIKPFGVIGKAVELGVGLALRSFTLDQLSHDNAKMIASSFLAGKELSEIWNLLEKCNNLEMLKLPAEVLPEERFRRSCPSLLSMIGPPDMTPTSLRVLHLNSCMTDLTNQEV
mmetsp:Transcript_19497/g.56096  ORF Transcript_19497/g.56096 Transcript_19497/m.56096 type:complete len:142 (+) Transcript_19497:440-865(+)